jgi:hypothetical protein
MPASLTEPTSPEVPIYCRRMVTILVDQIPQQKHHKMCGNASGFLISFRGSTWLITAGHVAYGLKKLYEAELILRLFLCDAWSGPDQRGTPIPLPQDSMRDWIILDAEAYDVAMLKLYENTVSLLTEGHIEIVAEDEWAHRPVLFDSYEMIGSPGEIRTSNEAQYPGMQGQDVRHLASLIDVKRGLFKLEQIPTPRNIEKPPFERFHARFIKVPDGIRINDIEGVSGGPVLGVINQTNGGDAYHTIAVQSGWYKDKTIVANYLYLLPEMLKAKGFSHLI